MGIAIAKRLKQIRKRAGMNQKEFAAALGDGCTQATISKYEQGDAEPPLDRLVKIADIGKVSIDWLVGRTEDRGGATPEIDQIGLDHESIRILEEMADKGEHEPGGAYFNPLNWVIQSPHLQEFLHAIKELERVADNFAFYYSEEMQQQDKHNREIHRKNSDIAIEDVKDLEHHLSGIARSWGYYVPVIADPDTAIQVKAEAVATAARKIATDLAKYDITNYFEAPEEEPETVVYMAAPKEEKGE